MKHTLKDLALCWKNETMTLEEAAQQARLLDFPDQIQDDDGEVWYDGEESNTSQAVYELVDLGILEPKEAHRFLARIAEATNQ